MNNFVFNRQKMMEYLTFMEIGINEFTLDKLRLRYHALAKKYHADSWKCFIGDDNDEKMIYLNNANEYLKQCIEMDYLWKNNTTNSNSRPQYRQISVFNELDKMVFPLKQLQARYPSDVDQYIIGSLLNFIDTYKTEAKNIDSIYDEGFIVNYCDLIGLFVERVYRINIGNNFDLEKNNYVYSNERYQKEKQEVCLWHKKLLYYILVKLIDFTLRNRMSMNLKQYKKACDNYFVFLSEVNDNVVAFLWKLNVPYVNDGDVRKSIEKIKNLKNRGGF